MFCWLPGGSQFFLVTGSDCLQPESSKIKIGIYHSAGKSLRAMVKIARFVL